MSQDPRRAPDADEAERRLAASFRRALEGAAAEAPDFEEVPAYVEGRLRGHERALFEERLAEDELLRAEVQDLRDLRGEMDRTRPARVAWVGWAAAAAVILSLAAGVLWMSGPKPSERAAGHHP